MPTRGRLENRVVNWLRKDGHDVQIQPHDKSIEFHVKINDIFKKAVDVGVFKYAQNDFIRIMTNYVPDNNILESYKKAAPSKLSSQQIIHGLHRELLKMNIDHSIEHDLTNITFVDDVYVEGITKSKIIGGIKKVRNASLYVLSVLNERFGTVTESKPSTNYRMYT